MVILPPPKPVKEPIIPKVQTLTDLARSNKKMGIITKKKNNSSEKG
jgi:hypothetical protein